VVGAAFTHWPLELHVVSVMQSASLLQDDPQIPDGPSQSIGEQGVAVPAESTDALRSSEHFVPFGVHAPAGHA